MNDWAWDVRGEGVDSYLIYVIGHCISWSKENVTAVSKKSTNLGGLAKYRFISHIIVQSWLAWALLHIVIQEPRILPPSDSAWALESSWALHCILCRKGKRLNMEGYVESFYRLYLEVL